MEGNSRIDLDKTNALLTETLVQQMPEPGSFHTEIKGFWTVRMDAPSPQIRGFYDNLITVTAQGKKYSLAGTEKTIYGPKQCTLLGMDLPCEGRIIEASPEKPCVYVALQLDIAILTELLTVIPPDQKAVSSRDEPCPQKGMALVNVDPNVLDAFLRLTELLKSPADHAVLAPMIIREIHYRLLMGPLGNRVKRIYTQGSRSHQIVQALLWIRNNYNKPLNIISLAKQINMAPSTFWRYFQHLTTMSPLQYQKWLRLYEARHLMLTEGMDANNAGYSVGYESIPQFNREYKRMFGETPGKNIKRLLTN